MSRRAVLEKSQQRYDACMPLAAGESSTSCSRGKGREGKRVLRLVDFKPLLVVVHSRGRWRYRARGSGSSS
jgi:hypothetical protein